MLGNFTFARFIFTIGAETRIRFPAYKGGTLRGGLGYALKRTVCVHRKAACEECMLQRQCVYSYIFDTSPPEGSDVLKKYSDVPGPFIIEPPLDGKTDYQSGEEMSFGLVLIGRAIELLPYFILSFENLGKSGLGIGRGRFLLQKVESEGNAVYRGEPGVLVGEPQVLSSSDLTPGSEMGTRRVKLKFLTPARIKHQGRLTDNPEFHILIRSLLRRASSLAYFHCGLSLDADPGDMISAAAQIPIENKDVRWYDWRRYSSRQKAEMKLGGILGQVTYAGDLEQFVPLLRLGEYIHVGKGASFGLGRYVLL